MNSGICIFCICIAAAVVLFLLERQMDAFVFLCVAIVLAVYALCQRCSKPSPIDLPSLPDSPPSRLHSPEVEELPEFVDPEEPVPEFVQPVEEELPDSPPPLSPPIAPATPSPPSDLPPPERWSENYAEYKKASEVQESILESAKPAPLAQAVQPVQKTQKKTEKKRMDKKRLVDKILLMP